MLGSKPPPLSRDFSWHKCISLICLPRLAIHLVCTKTSELHQAYTEFNDIVSVLGMTCLSRAFQYILSLNVVHFVSNSVALFGLINKVSSGLAILFALTPI